MLTLAMVDAMRQHKQELYALVEAFEERAALMEYDGRLPRDKARRWPGCVSKAHETYARCESRGAGARSMARWSVPGSPTRFTKAGGGVGRRNHGKN